jgi:hypothetical protein
MVFDAMGWFGKLAHRPFSCQYKAVPMRERDVDINAQKQRHVDLF